jgi:DNA-binding NtrC family response regulator
MNGEDSILVVSQKYEAMSSYFPTLREMGFKVYSARNLQEALDYIQIRNYALVLISLDSPRETDVRQIAWMRSIRRKLPILLMIKKVPRRLIPEFQRAGMSEYLLKPVKGKQFAHTVKKLVPLTSSLYS